MLAMDTAAVQSEVQEIPEGNSEGVVVHTEWVEVYAVEDPVEPDEADSKL